MPPRRCADSSMVCWCGCNGVHIVRVALVTGEYPPMRGGVADYTSLLAGALCRFGVEVSVLTSSRAAGRRNGDGPPRIVTSVKNWGPRSWHDVAEHVELFQPDIIHLQYQAGAFDLNAAVTVLPWVNRLRGGQPRLLVTFHDLKVPYILPKIGPVRQLAPPRLCVPARLAKRFLVCP